ncbi:MAG: hypothetical protein CL955_03980 [Erythrobacteraceae bacterium]|nr:hypothetical protein [Erythrobacteraceae bacterium]|tara:strand:+ start:291 stop:737 length:447 start_codon:yes stop_codon:yes gene_type:complete
MKTTTFLTQLAAEEFARRRSALRRAVDLGRMSHEAANVNAQCWLAIARAAGADLPEMYVECLWPRGKRSLMHHSQIADPAAWRAELTRARDMAVRKALSDLKDLKAQQRAWDLQSLAVHLGCPDVIELKQQSDSSDKKSIDQIEKDAA